RDSELELGAIEDATIEHGAADVARGEGEGAATAPFGRVEESTEDRVGSAVERAAGADEQVECRLSVPTVLEHGAGAQARRYECGLEHAGDRRQRTDDEEGLVGG